MFQIKRSKKFKREHKKIVKNNLKINNILTEILNYFLLGKELPVNFKAHHLQGTYKDCYECHVQPDILLIYKIDKKDELLTLLRIGSHANLFD